MAEERISGIMETTMDKIKAMVDANTIIGEKIVVNAMTDEEVTFIPISKLSFGFASGATDLKGKNNSAVFAGGGGAGASVVPVGFLVIKQGNVKMLPVPQYDTTAGRAIEMMPEAIERIKAIFKKDKSNK